MLIVFRNGIAYIVPDNIKANDIDAYIDNFEQVVYANEKKEADIYYQLLTQDIQHN